MAKQIEPINRITNRYQRQTCILDGQGITACRPVVHTQGSKEWREWRATRMTASDAAVPMRCVPAFREVRTLDDLRLDKVQLSKAYRDGKTYFRDWLFRLGHKRESETRAALEEKYAVIFLTLCLEKDNYSASLDGFCCDPNRGLHGDSPLWIEIKTALHGERSSIWQHIERHSNDPCARNRIPAHIWWQMVHQCMVMSPKKTDFADLVIYLESGGKHKMPITSFTEWNNSIYQDTDKDEEAPSFDERRIRNIRISCFDLLADVPLLEQRWKEFEDGVDHGWHIEGYRQLATVWLNCRNRLDEARDELNIAHADLAEHIEHGQSITGAGIKVAHAPREGKVNWQEVSKHLFALIKQTNIPATQKAKSSLAPLKDVLPDDLSDIAEDFRGDTELKVMVSRVHEVDRLANVVKR